MQVPTESTPSSQAAKATLREWIGLAVIALPCLLYSMDLTVLNLAVPALSADLKPTGAQLLWIVDIYGFMIAGSLITMGTLGDRIGRRKLLLIGAAAFGAASVLAAFSNSAEMLIATRALLGVAGATLAPSTLSLIRNMFTDPRERTVAISVWVTSFSAGGAIGPLVGGVMLEHFWWGSVFLVGVPVMVLLLILGPLLLPEYRDPNPGRLDIVSALQSLVAVLAVIYGLKRIAEGGMGWLPFLIIAGGLAVGCAFVARQRRLASPLIDLSLFQTPAFTAALVINLFCFFGAFATFLLTSQYLQLYVGLSPLQAGWWSVPGALGFIAGSMLAPVVTRYVTPARAVAGSLAVAALGFAVLTQVGGPSGLAVLVVGSIIFSLGLSPVATLISDLIVSCAPPERAGSAAAMSETSFELGGALGIAVIGSVVTAVYRSAMADAALAGVPLEAAQVARSTLGGALAVASQLPGGAGAALLDAARSAFADAFQVAASISAAIVAVTAMVAAWALRQPAPAPIPDVMVGVEAKGRPCAESK
jgi:MFS transporter, DHA2 family, multidrug resistance protein